MSKKNILLTGGFGFVGTNLLLELSKEYNIYIVDNFYKNDSKNNFKIYKHKCFKFEKISITNKNRIEQLIKSVKFYAIINLAAQVAMTKSLENPLNDFRTNVIGTLNILEAIRKYSKHTMFFNISSNKVYGDMQWDNLVEKKFRYESKKFINGYTEDIPLDFSGPYGCSKGSAEQYVLNYSKIYNLKTVSFRLSTIYGINQYSTFDQGWIGWFTSEIIRNSNEKYKLEVHGDGKQVRDILYIDDFVSLIQVSLRNFIKINGKAYNIGGGKNNTISILELINFICESQKIVAPQEIIKKEWRTADQKFYCSNTDKIKKDLDWTPKVTLDEGITEYFNWILKKFNNV